jgi:hypothetical protein
VCQPESQNLFFPKQKFPLVHKSPSASSVYFGCVLSGEGLDFLGRPGSLGFSLGALSLRNGLVSDGGGQNHSLLARRS